MKLALVADTHGSIEHVIGELKTKEIDYIFHLGDYLEDGYAISEALNVKCFVVQGNNDYFAMGEPQEAVKELGGLRILMTHGHRYGVYSGTDKLLNRALKLECDIVLYGHTHIFNDTVIQNVRIINPGSASYGRGFDRESIAILDTETNILERILISH